MIVLVTGSRGLVGSALLPALEGAGHTVRRLSLRGLGSDPVSGSDPLRPSLWSALDGADAIVHLAGEPIAEARWTPLQKSKIRDSRVRVTGTLCDAIARLTTPPKTFISASAIGYYGNRGDEILREDSVPGTGFLPEVAVAWEQAARGLGSDPAVAGSDPLRVSSALSGVRVVCLRFGIILSLKGGALAKMLPPFRLGLGGPLGSGKQWFSWVTLEDVVGIIQFALATESLRGPVNAVAPRAVTNADFTKALGRALRRPAVIPTPAFVLRLLLGEMADALLLASARVEPATLTAAGYRFRHPELEPALRALLA